MEVVWACCSSKRTEMIRKKTLRTLTRGNFTGTLTLCVPFEELEEYRAALDADKENRIAIQLIGSEKGLIRQRQTVRDMLPIGQRIMFIDDDIAAIKLIRDGVFGHATDLEAIVEDCFNQLPPDCLLWGCYPVANRGWMKNRIAIGTALVVGAFYGCINDPRLKEPDALDDCEDFARQLLEITEGRKPQRFEWMGIDTVFFKNPGGIHQGPTDTQFKKRADAVKTLCEKYPSLIRRKVRRADAALPDLAFSVKPSHLESVAPSLIAVSDTSSDAPSAPL